VSVANFSRSGKGDVVKLRPPSKVVETTATPTQIAVLTHPARFKSVVATRKWGKSTCGKLKVLARVGRPKRGGLFQWIAPIYRQCDAVYRDLFYTFKSMGQLVAHDSQKLQLDLATGWRVDFRSMDGAENIRGDTPDEIVIDEIGQIPDDKYEEVVRPSIMTTQAPVTFLGTPKGRRGVGYKMWTRGQPDPVTGRPLDPLYKSWRFTCYDATFIPRSEIEEAKRTMSQRAFAQELLAEFLDTTGVVFENVRARRCTPLDDEPVGIGADWAKDVDFTWFVATGCVSGAIQAVQRLPHRMSYIQQVAALVEFCKQFQGRGYFVCHDKTGVGNAIDDILLQTYGNFFTAEENLESFLFTGQSKNELVEEGIVAFEAGQLGFVRQGEQEPIYETLIREHEEFALEVSSKGRISYGAPDGMHDDAVIATLLSNRARRRVAAGQGGGSAGMLIL